MEGDFIFGENFGEFFLIILIFVIFVGVFGDVLEYEEYLFLLWGVNWVGSLEIVVLCCGGVWFEGDEEL